MAKLLPIITSVFVCYFLTFAYPEILSKNEFLDDLFSHEIVSILVVFLSITMGVAVNVHLALTRFKAKLMILGVNVDQEIKEARVELTRKSMFLFSLFCVLLIVLTLKGSVMDAFWVSAIHSTGIIIVTATLVAVYDLYVAMYFFASQDISAGSMEDISDDQ